MGISPSQYRKIEDLKEIVEKIEHDLKIKLRDDDFVVLFKIRDHEVPYSFNSAEEVVAFLKGVRATEMETQKVS